MALPATGTMDALLTIIADCEDDIEIGTDRIFLFTWNPKPAFYEKTDKFKNEFEYEHNWKKMLHYLRHINRCSKKYCILPELSDTGKLHAHGWFIMSDSIKWKKSVYNTIASQGFVKVNKCNSLKAMYYYKKDLSETIEFIPHKLIICSHLTLKHVLEFITKEKVMLDIGERPKYDIVKFFMLE